MLAKCVLNFLRKFSKKADFDSLVKIILWTIFFALLIFIVYYTLKGAGIV